MEDSAQSQCSFYLEPVDGHPLPSYKPGQFLTFSLALGSDSGAAVDEITRCYSLSDAPNSAHYRVTIKRAVPPLEQPSVPPGKSSSYFLDRVQVGDVLQVRAPSGRFYLDPDSSTPVVLIGGGIGLTPMMSMLHWCLEHQPGRTVHLYYGVRNSKEHAFKSLLQELAANAPQFHLHLVYSVAAQSDVLGVDYHHAGQINVALLKQTLRHGQHQFYVCGPAAMMESLVPALAAWGVALADIHFEAFGPASVHLPNPQSSVAPEDTLASPVNLEIRFKLSQRSLAWDGRDANLLDFAESHGISVESGCRSGSCGSCATPLLSGQVLYEHIPDFELAPGQCLLCVGKPASALVLGA
jgi:ferredoxin-NADP reductase